MQLGEGMSQKDQIPEDKMMEIVEDVVNMGVKTVTFSEGGEPFLYKPLPEVSKKLIDDSIQIASLTKTALNWKVNWQNILHIMVPGSAYL